MSRWHPDLCCVRCGQPILTDGQVCRGIQGQRWLCVAPGDPMLANLGGVRVSAGRDYGRPTEVPADPYGAGVTDASPLRARAVADPYQLDDGGGSVEGPETQKGESSSSPDPPERAAGPPLPIDDHGRTPPHGDALARAKESP